MNVHQVVETEDGRVEFKGELSGAELSAVVTAGLNYLLKLGALVKLRGDEADKESMN